MQAWLEAYGKWPTMHQLAFSMAVLTAGLFLVILFLMALYHFVQFLVVLARGWPAARNDPSKPQWKDVKELNELLASYRRWDERNSSTLPINRVASVNGNGNGALFEKHPVG